MRGGDYLCTALAITTPLISHSVFSCTKAGAFHQVSTKQNQSWDVLGHLGRYCISCNLKLKHTKVYKVILEAPHNLWISHGQGEWWGAPQTEKSQREMRSIFLVLLHSAWREWLELLMCFTPDIAQVEKMLRKLIEWVWTFIHSQKIRSSQRNKCSMSC